MVVLKIIWKCQFRTNKWKKIKIHVIPLSIITFDDTLFKARSTATYHANALWSRLCHTILIRHDQRISNSACIRIYMHSVKLIGDIEYVPHCFFSRILIIWNIWKLQINATWNKSNHIVNSIDQKLYTFIAVNAFQCSSSIFPPIKLKRKCSFFWTIEFHNE